MSEPRRCPACGAEIPADALEGLCPRCVMQAALASQSASSDPGRPSSATAPFSPSPGFVPPALAALAALFPHLQILELVGSGGMGAVYKARQPGLDRLVALKILPPEVGADPAFAERFTREARALAKLSHPNIVAVYDFGRSASAAAPAAPGGLFYFLMEYVDGVNLRQAMRQAKLQPAEALKIVPQICDALQFAHDEGIVHRDIKPENILLDKRGRVKIADFGLAKLLGVKADHALTGTRQVMGTPHYMAPEQIQGTRDVDHRADIYSLGVTFYEMLTGELPLGRFPPPSKKVQIDVRLDEVVLRALEREPEQRYQHASDVKTEVEQIAFSAVGAKAPPSSRPITRKEALEHTIADLLPDDKVAAVRIYREATAASLAEAMSAVKAIAQKHGKDRPVPFSWEHFTWAVVWSVAMIAGGFWLAETQNNRANQLMFRLGGFIAALFAVASNLTWQQRRSRWSLEDLEEDLEEAEEESKAPTKTAAPAKTAGDEPPSRATVQKTADGLLLWASIALLTGIGALAWVTFVGVPSRRGADEDFWAAVWRDPINRDLVAMGTAEVIFSFILGIAAILLRGLRARLLVLILVVLLGLFFPSVVALNVIMEFRHIPTWPLLIPLWLGMPLALWSAWLLFRDDVRRLFEHEPSPAALTPAAQAGTSNAKRAMVVATLLAGALALAMYLVAELRESNQPPAMNPPKSLPPVDAKPE
jgi:serine/threonine protein kinase